MKNGNREGTRISRHICIPFNTPSLHSSEKINNPAIDSNTPAHIRAAEVFPKHL